MINQLPQPDIISMRFPLAIAFGVAVHHLERMFFRCFEAEDVWIGDALLRFWIVVKIGDGIYIETIVIFSVPRWQHLRFIVWTGQITLAVPFPYSVIFVDVHAPNVIACRATVASPGRSYVIRRIACPPSKAMQTVAPAGGTQVTPQSSKPPNGEMG